MANWVGALGATLFVIVFLIDGATRPGYSPSRHPVSALALGPRGWIQRANFVACGAAITAGALGMVTGGGHRMLALALVVLGLGLVASVVPMDPMRGYPPGAPEGDPEEFSAAHSMHDGAGAIVFFALPVIAGISAFALPGLGWSITAALMTILLLATLTAFDRGWKEGSATAGTAQRRFLVPGLVWVALIFLALA